MHAILSKRTSKVNEQDAVEYIEEDHEWEPNQLGHKAAKCIMGIPENLQNKHSVDIFPAGIQARGSDANRISDPKPASASMWTIKQAGVGMGSIGEVVQARGASDIKHNADGSREVSMKGVHRPTLAR